MDSKNGNVGLGAIIISLFNILMNALLLFYFILFLKWYIKGHFSKHFIFFWAFTIMSIIVFKYESDRLDREYQEYWDNYGSKSGTELWNEKMKDYDAVRGY